MTKNICLSFRCQFHNFSRNKECYECRTERPREAGRVSGRGDSTRSGQWDRETPRSSYGRTEERGRSSYEERGRPSYKMRGRSSYEERGRPSYGESSYERPAERGRPSFSRSEERSRPSNGRRDVWERPSDDESEGLERFERTRSAEGVAEGRRRKHEEWQPAKTVAKPSRFNFDISDGSDEDFASTLSSDDDYKDIGFGDESEDSEPEERSLTRGRGSPEKGFRGGRIDDRPEARNSGVSRMRSQSEPPPSRGRNRRERELSSSSGDDEDFEDFEDFEDLDFGDESDDQEDRAVSSSRGGREFARGGRGDSGAGRSRAPWTREGASMESRGITPIIFQLLFILMCLFYYCVSDLASQFAVFVLSSDILKPSTFDYCQHILQ